MHPNSSSSGGAWLVRSQTLGPDVAFFDQQNCFSKILLGWYFLSPNKFYSITFFSCSQQFLFLKKHKFVKKKYHLYYLSSVICHLCQSFAIYGIWYECQMTDDISDKGNMGVKRSVWTSGIQPPILNLIITSFSMIFFGSTQN